MTEDEEFEALEQRLNMKETKQPEALRRLSDLESMHERGTIRRGHIDEMLSELRRLHAENKLLKSDRPVSGAFFEAEKEIDRLHALNQELLEALKAVVDSPDEDSDVEAYENALKAIAKAQGASNE